ncbi:MAG: hypothetical protein ACJ746_11870 [Bryobacteraceae bacterium]
MSAVYTSGLGTYLWDGVNQSQSGQAAAVGALGSLPSTHSGNAASIDIASISERAQLFSGLETLSRNNPARFQKNTAAIAQYLRSAAANEEDPGQSGVLKGTASSFEQASQTGNFSDLFLHESQGFGAHEPEPYAVSQIYSHVLSQVSSDVQSSNTPSAK